MFAPARNISDGQTPELKWRHQAVSSFYPGSVQDSSLLLVIPTMPSLSFSVSWRLLSHLCVCYTHITAHQWKSEVCRSHFSPPPSPGIQLADLTRVPLVAEPSPTPQARASPVSLAVGSWFGVCHSVGCIPVVI